MSDSEGGVLEYSMGDELLLRGRVRGAGGGDVLACGFGMTVGVWLVAYLSKMPLVQASGQATIFAMLVVVLAGGFLAGRYSEKGVWAAVWAGGVSGLLDLLILGSVMKDMMANREIAPAAVLWIGGSIGLNAVVAGIGGLVGGIFASPRREVIRWPAVFALVLAAATLPLITAGGLVTAFHAGLAVPDWPESYGYNMFLFPLSKMQSAEGNFYEHSHRLMGSLVGLTSLTLAIYVSVVERRRWVKGLAWGIFFAVCVQGILGGTRVTEKSVTLAMAHGVFAQLVFASMAGLAAVSGRTFLEGPRGRGGGSGVGRAGASTDRAFANLFLGAMVIQLMLGALVRHKDALVLLHITMAVVVTMLAVTCGFRAWGLHGDVRALRNTGLAVIGVVLLQLLLGVLALLWRSGPANEPTAAGAFLTTAHQANGALLLSLAAVLFVWNWRLLRPVEAALVQPVAPVPLARAIVHS